MDIKCDADLEAVEGAADRGEAGGLVRGGEVPAARQQLPRLPHYSTVQYIMLQYSTPSIAVNSMSYLAVN